MVIVDAPSRFPCPHQLLQAERTHQVNIGVHQTCNSELPGRIENGRGSRNNELIRWADGPDAVAVDIDRLPFSGVFRDSIDDGRVGNDQ